MASSSNLVLNDSTIEVNVMDEKSAEELEESTIQKNKPQNFNSNQPREAYGTSPAFKSDVKHEILTQKAKMNIKPHLGNAARDYLQLVREENSFKNEPEWDRSEECLIQDMIQSKINNTLARVLLKKKREEYMQIRAKRDKQIEDIKREQLNLGATFIYFDKFVKENIEKRERFLDKIRSEKDIQDELNKKITQAESSIQTFNHLKNEMIKFIEIRKKFVDFLESVREISPDSFRNGVHEIIERYELLMMVREELANEQARAIERMQELSDKIYKITKNRTEELMNLRNKVTELYRRYDAAKRDSFYWESLVNKVEDMAAKQTLEISSVKNACWNLYLLICEHHKLPVLLEKRQIRKQLHVIENTILQLRRALYIAKKRKGKKMP